MGRRSLPTDEMNLTEREHRMLDFLKENIVNRGYPPTVREICEHLGVKSTSTVHKDLAALEAKGFIRKDPSKPRAIEIAGFDMKRLEETAAPGAAEREAEAVPADVIEVPVIGQVAAGMPILAEQNVTDTFPVPASYVNGNGTHFILKVKGDSMIEAGILSGDYILVKQQNEARNGQMVVAMVDGFESEATVKTFYKEDGHIRLQPENQTMSPIIVRDAKVLGIVRGVFRYFN